MFEFYIIVGIIYKSAGRIFSQNREFLLLLMTKRGLYSGNKTCPDVTKVNEFSESMGIKRSSKRLRNIVGS